MPLLEQIAAAKKLPSSFLRGLEIRNMGAKGIQIPYRGLDGHLLRYRYRRRLSGDRGFEWGRGSRVYLYGLDQLRGLPVGSPILLVEGESDCWTAWHWGQYFVLGLPGKEIWRPEWASLFGGKQVYVWQEPDAADLPVRIGKDVPNLKVIHAPTGVKDLSEAHVNGCEIRDLLRDRMKTAVAVKDLPPSRAATRPLKTLPQWPEGLLPEGPVQDEVLVLVQHNGGLVKVFSCPLIRRFQHRLFQRVKLPSNPTINRNIPCPLHTDVEGRSATLQVNRHGAMVVKCWHVGRIVTIPQLYAALTTGNVRRLKGLEHRLWAIRLLLDSGILARPQVDLPPLPPGLQSWGTLKTVYEGAKIRAECGSITRQVNFAYTVSFVVRWCGLHDADEIRAAIQTLVELEILCRVKLFTAASSTPKRTTWLYAVGSHVLGTVPLITLARAARFSKNPPAVLGIATPRLGYEYGI